MHCLVIQLHSRRRLLASFHQQRCMFHSACCVVIQPPPTAASCSRYVNYANYANCAAHLPHPTSNVVVNCTNVGPTVSRSTGDARFSGTSKPKDPHLGFFTSFSLLSRRWFWVDILPGFLHPAGFLQRGGRPPGIGSNR